MKLIKLKIELDGQGISRTILVPADWTLYFLSKAIMTSLGWLEYHVWEFEDAKQRRYGEDCEEVLFEDEAPRLLASLFAIRSVLKKKGDKLVYTYDLGDLNQHTITCLGFVEETDESVYCEESIGTDAVEDCAALGWTRGVIETLRANKRGKKQKMIEDWLMDAFKKTAEEVLHEPSAREMHERIASLVHLIQKSR